MSRIPERRIALVAPFFGREAGGPDERFAFEFAAQLTVRGASLVVVTTCARSAADDWSANYYRAGRDVTEAFPIERFRVEPRDRPAYRAALLRLVDEPSAAPDVEETFLREGVHSPGLLAHLRRIADAHDAFIFTPYAAATTLQALPFVAERAIVLPYVDDDPLLHARIVRERLGTARAFLLRDEGERDRLLASLGGGIAPRCRVIGPLAGDAHGWDLAHAGIAAVVDNLAALDDGRSRERALAQVAYLYPIVRRQRSVIIAMQQSRFWQIRNAWFALKRTLRFKGEDVLPQLAPETAAAELSAVGDPYFLWRERQALRAADIERLEATAAVLARRPPIALVVDAGGATVAALDRTLRSLQAQIWTDWRATIVFGVPPQPAYAVACGFAERDARICVGGDPADALDAAPDDAFMLELPAGDLLEADAFVTVALAANVDPELDVLYADEDESDGRGGYRLPRMKPDWSPETVLARDYVGRPCFLRAGALRRAGGLRPAYGAAMWYDALLRVSEQDRAHRA